MGHNSHCSLIELGATTSDHVNFDTSDCVGLVPLGPETLMTVSGHGELHLTGIVTGRSAEIGVLSHRPPVLGVAAGDETMTYIAAGTEDGTTTVFAIEFATPVLDVVMRTFAAADSGDLAGYRAQVLGLAGRQVPPSNRGEDELQALFHDAARLVQEQLHQPIDDRVRALGLEPLFDTTGRQLAGGRPPAYGGGAGCPRWRVAGQQTVWLEAWIGLGYRIHPSTRWDDAVLSTMLAIMTADQQHTLLTRFVPVTPGDGRLEATIRSILADVDRVLPNAVDVPRRPAERNCERTGRGVGRHRLPL